MLVGASWGVVRLSVLKTTWRRSVKIDFGRTLNKSAGSTFFSTLVIAAISGVAIVAQAVYWLGFAGVAQSTGDVLAHILVKEIAPIFVSILLLGRTGMLMIADLAAMSLTGQIRALRGIGVDPFVQFVVPKTLALTIASFTLGIVFSECALITGYITCWAKGIVVMPVWSFLYQVMAAMDPIDYIGIPLKFLLSGFIIALSCTMTGLDVHPDDELGDVLPRGFFRGILSVLVMNVALDIVV